MSGTGFHSEFGDWKAASKGQTFWAKAEDSAKPTVQTATGHTVDFFTRNFDVKHLMLVENAQAFPALLAQASQRQQDRAASMLIGHDGKPVMKYVTNSAIVLTPGTLAAWGGLIARDVSGRAADGTFKGASQWHVHSKLPGAAYFTHSGKAGSSDSAGMGVTVTVTCARSGNMIYVVHLGTKETETFSDPKRGVSTMTGPFTEAETKRVNRFLKSVATDDGGDLGIGALWD